LEVVGPGGNFHRAAQNHVAQGFLFLATERAESGGTRGQPGRVGSKVALMDPHLIDATSHELSQAPERVGGKRHGEGVVEGGRMVQTPVVEHDQVRFGLEGRVDRLHDTV